MKITTWSINTRNALSSIAGEFDSCAAIDGACMTSDEREKCKKHLRAVVKFLDKEHDKARKKQAKLKK